MQIGTVEDLIRDMEAGVFDYTENGECSSCGACCADFLPVGKGEIKRIRDYIRKHGITERKHRPPTAQKFVDETCPFRDNDARRCAIYPVRPMICRDFRCDKPKQQIWADRSRYERELDIVSMRETFFGGE